MRVYREHEVIDIIKIAAILFDREITPEEAWKAVETHKHEVETQYPSYPWLPPMPLRAAVK